MTYDVVKDLYLPFWVLIIGSLVVFLAQLSHKRETLAAVILAEINQILIDITSTIEYLSSDSHYWLSEGHVINTAPLDTSPPPRFYHAAIPELHLFRTAEVKKIFSFYQQYEKTENLKKNLFLRIREYANAAKPLDKKAVERLMVEKTRTVQSYLAILNSVTFPISKLKKLPDSYLVESTASIAQRINLLSSSQHMEVDKMCSPKHEPVKQAEPPKKEEQKEGDKKA